MNMFPISTILSAWNKSSRQPHACKYCAKVEWVEQKSVRTRTKVRTDLNKSSTAYIYKLVDKLVYKLERAHVGDGEKSKWGFSHYPIYSFEVCHG